MTEAEITNETETEMKLPYSMTEQYQEDLDYWYEYYKPSKTILDLKDRIYAILMDETKSWGEKQAIIKPLMGWDDALNAYMSDNKTVDYETGEVTYEDESIPSLPKTQAEGDALYKLYNENFEEYVQALKDAGNP